MYTKITSRCVIWDAQFKWWFERRYFGPCVRQITSRFVIWNAQFKWWCGPSFELRISKYRLSNFNSKCAFQIKIKITHFAVVWKQSDSWVINCELYMSQKTPLHLHKLEETCQKLNNHITYFFKFWCMILLSCTTHLSHNFFQETHLWPVISELQKLDVTRTQCHCYIRISVFVIFFCWKSTIKRNVCDVHTLPKGTTDIICNDLVQMCNIFEVMITCHTKCPNTVKLLSS